MKALIARMLRSIGLLKFDLLTYSTSSFPSEGELPAERLVLVRDGRVERWACSTCRRRPRPSQKPLIKSLQAPALGCGRGLLAPTYGSTISASAQSLLLPFLDKGSPCRLVSRWAANGRAQLNQVQSCSAIPIRLPAPEKRSKPISSLCGIYLQRRHLFPPAKLNLRDEYSTSARCASMIVCKTDSIRARTRPLHGCFEKDRPASGAG